LETGEHVALKSLQVGDKIKIDAEANVFEAVYGFGHREESIVGNYLKIGWAPNSYLEISSEHMLLVSSSPSSSLANRGFRMISASKVKVGDTIKVEGKDVHVKSITKTRAKGLYAPLTYSGKIVVNGVQASQYISIQKNEESLVLGPFSLLGLNHHWLVHTFLLPLRVVSPILMKGSNNTQWMQPLPLGID
jgi:hypothetical protein